MLILPSVLVQIIKEKQNIRRLKAGLTITARMDQRLGFGVELRVLVCKGWKLKDLCCRINTGTK